MGGGNRTFAEERGAGRGGAGGSKFWHFGTLYNENIFLPVWILFATELHTHIYQHRALRSLQGESALSVPEQKKIYRKKSTVLIILISFVFHGMVWLKQ